MELKIGDIVKVLYPFNYAFPDAYPVEAVKPDGTCVICGDRDFDPVYLELAE